MGSLIRMEQKKKKGQYCNKDAVDKVVGYITRTSGSKEGENDLVLYGGAGVIGNDPRNMIADMNFVQDKFNINSRGGRRIHHSIYTINEEEFGKLGCSLRAIELMAKECAENYYDEGHQVAYAVHMNDLESKGYMHIHFAVNTINVNTGKKYHESFHDLDCKKEQFNQIQESISERCPVHFRDLSKIEVDRNSF